MGTLIIERKAELSNSFRQISVYIDGKKAGTIANGETREYDLPQGSHEVCCKIDWCTSNTIEVSGESELIRILQLSGFKNSGWIIPIAVAVTIVSLILRAFGFASRYFFLIHPDPCIHHYVILSDIWQAQLPDLI
ncbi:MAG: hypothetical protein U0T56_10585 [Ferruginibacter sp.]